MDVGKQLLIALVPLVGLVLVVRVGWSMIVGAVRA